MTGRPTGGRDRSGRSVFLVLAACIGVLLLSACTFERRGDPGGEAPTAAPDATDSVRMVVSSLDEALQDGDLAAARNLFDADARVSSLGPFQGETVSWRSPDQALAGEGLPGGEASWTLVDSRIESPAPGSALVLNRYAVAGDPAGGSGVLETLVLVRRGGEWRIRHLHRSFLHPAGMVP